MFGSSCCTTMTILFYFIPEKEILVHLISSGFLPWLAESEGELPVFLLFHCRWIWRAKNTSYCCLCFRLPVMEYNGVITDPETLSTIDLNKLKGSVHFLSCQTNLGKNMIHCGLLERPYYIHFVNILAISTFKTGMPPIRSIWKGLWKMLEVNVEMLLFVKLCRIRTV